MNVTYHSHHGAIQESLHVFIQSGLHALVNPPTHQPVNILEIGFGTGLNALLTLMEAEKLQQPVHYTTIELYPLQQNEMTSLNYCEQLKRTDMQPVFQLLHQCDWGKKISINPFFTIHKVKTSLLRFKSPSPQHLIYFDAFAPTAQPELWTKEVFEKLFTMMLPGGILVTYCSKGDVRRSMQAAGFAVEKIPGPPGKREMVRATLPAAG